MTNIQIPRKWLEKLLKKADEIEIAEYTAELGEIIGYIESGAAFLEDTQEK